MSAIKVSHYKIRITDPDNQPQQPFSIAVLADLHNASFGDGNTDLLREIRNADPKIVLSAGDLVVAKAGHSAAARAVCLLGELTRRYPVYCVNGNHESRMANNPQVFGTAYENYIQEISSLGVHFLHNAKHCLKINGMKLAVYGYELEQKYYRHRRCPEPSVEEMSGALGEPMPEEYSILLAHHPNYFSSYAAWGADLTLAGHLHGGMIRLPKLGGVISPGWTLFPKYDKGLYKINDKKMIVSAGLGSHTIKLRINNPPELVVADFV